MKKLVEVARMVSERILYLISEDEQTTRGQQMLRRSTRYLLGF
ncbi:MAG: hypothetical protein HW402_612 [Dehalococcoidales bacterium]|nr:hypothetical protein [Dehalococcoidales bacterium]